MTDNEKIAGVKMLSEEADNGTISAALFLVGEELCAAYDIYDEAKKTAFLDKYGAVHVKATAYTLNKRGWDFETSHSENGIGRVFERGGLPDSILRMIPAQVKVVK